jgi:curli biogenesis system outer membrane secretion channel CsgG
MARSNGSRGFLRALTLAAALASPALIAAGPSELPCPAHRPSVAVAKLGAAYDGAGIDLGAVAAGQLVSALHATGCFELHERLELASLINERELAAAGIAQSADPAPLAAPDWILVGSVSAAEPTRRGRRFGLSIPFAKLPMDVGFGGSRSQAEVALDLRLVDAASWRVLAVIAARGSANAGDGGFSLNHRRVGTSADASASAPLGDAARAAAANAVEQLVAASHDALALASAR